MLLGKLSSTPTRPPRVALLAHLRLLLLVLLRLGVRQHGGVCLLQRRRQRRQLLVLVLLLLLLWWRLRLVLGCWLHLAAHTDNKVDC
jgi:hypothetical protein